MTIKCKICLIERKKGSGYSYLLTHLEKHQLNIIKDLVVQEKGGKTGPMNFHVKSLSEDAKTYHDWIEWIVLCNHPFTFVESKYTRKNSKLGEISKKTLLEYMVKVKNYASNRSAYTYLYIDSKCCQDTNCGRAS